MLFGALVQSLATYHLDFKFFIILVIYMYVHTYVCMYERMYIEV